MIYNIDKNGLPVKETPEIYDYLMGDGNFDKPTSYDMSYGNHTSFTNVNCDIDIYWNKAGRYITAIFKLNNKKVVTNEQGITNIFGATPTSGPVLPKPVCPSSLSYVPRPYGLYTSTNNLSSITAHYYFNALITNAGYFYLEHTFNPRQSGGIPVGVHYFQMNYLCQ